MQSGIEIIKWTERKRWGGGVVGGSSTVQAPYLPSLSILYLGPGGHLTTLTLSPLRQFELELCHLQSKGFRGIQKTECCVTLTISVDFFVYLFNQSQSKCTVFH